MYGIYSQYCFGLGIIIADAEIRLIITEAMIFSVFSIIWFMRGEKTAIKNMQKQMNKLKKENGKLYSDKGTLIFNSNGITDISEDKELKTPYSTVTQLCIGHNALYIYFSPVMAYIIPFRTINSNCSVDEFKSFIESNTSLTFK